MADFMEHKPGSTIGDLKFPCQGTGRAAAFIGGEEIDSPKPLLQRQVAMFHDRAHGYRSLITAFGALVEASGFNLVALGMAAFRAEKTVWSFKFEEVFAASLLVREKFLERQKTVDGDGGLGDGLDEIFSFYRLTHLFRTFVR